MSEREIFLAALDLPESARADYLARACATDPDLRGRVEALLRSHRVAGSFLGHPAAPAPLFPHGVPLADGHPTVALPDIGNETVNVNSVRMEPADSREEGVGTTIAGRYTLECLIGEGGMGTVYHASQTEPIRRSVALKLVRAGMDSRAVLARFEAERQALALMEHPNIARVYDGGTTPAGRPYFVMELVRGVPLTDYCDAHRLPVGERLQLFVHVCEAVQHAHQKGIIHRDLKPSNVLVTEWDGRPTPKVIDFGVAKATGSRLTELSFADTGAIVGTPTYMSPEQADPSSMDIDTRTDVYALGVILYELLVGSPPLDPRQFRRGAVLEMLRMVREVDPPKPSTKLSTAEALPSIAANRNIEPARLATLLRGELDWVVMKAIEKDRGRRYETVSGLARDVRRYLADEVVDARPPSAGYRLRKFARRNQGQVIAAGLVFIALVAGVIGTTWGLILARRANAELAAANTRVDQRYTLAVEAIQTFHSGVSEDFLLRQAAFKDLRDRLLTSAAEFYGKLSALLGAETDPAARRSLARSNFELAELTGKVGRFEDALASHRAVLTARESLAAEPGAGAAVRADVGRSRVAVATALEAVGQPTDALETYRRAEELLSDLAGTDPLALSALVSCQLRMGWLQSKLNKTDDALETYKRARANLKRMPGQTATRELRRDEADAVVRTGLLLQQTGKSAEAGIEYRAARDLFQFLVDEYPASVSYRNSLAFCHNSIGFLLTQSGQSAMAEDEYRTALRICQKLSDENPGVTEFRGRVGQCHHNLGSVLVTRGKLEAAEAENRRALEIRQKLADENPTATDVFADLSSTRNNLGNLLLLLDKPAEAKAEYLQSLAIRRKLLETELGIPDRRRYVGVSLNNLGAVEVRLGRYEEAIDRYRESIGIHDGLVRAFPKTTSYRNDLAFALNGLGRSLHRMDRSPEAVEPLRRAVALRAGLTAMSVDARYDLAVGRALLAAITSDPTEADRAMDDLRRAVSAGYRKTAVLRADRDLEPLRSREDFRKLMADIEKEKLKSPETAPIPRQKK